MWERKREKDCLVRSPAVNGKNRCRVHGGGTGSGAPKGNANALNHGFNTNESMGERKLFNQMIKGYRKILKELSGI